LKHAKLAHRISIGRRNLGGGKSAVYQSNERTVQWKGLGIALGGRNLGEGKSTEYQSNESLLKMFETYRTSRGINKWHKKVSQSTS